MKATEQEIRLSEKEMEIVKAYAEEHGMTLDDAASALLKAAIEKKFRRNLNRGPARVYDLPRRTN